MKKIITTTTKPTKPNPTRTQKNKKNKEPPNLTFPGHGGYRPSFPLEKKKKVLGTRTRGKEKPTNQQTDQLSHVYLFGLCYIFCITRVTTYILNLS